MGIPRFVRILVSRYPLIMRNILNKEELPETDYFYIDIRHIIHQISHGNKENILFLIKHKSFNKIYKEICMAIEELINTVCPKKFVMIADDGVCPLAKLPEIIKRRFIGGNTPKGIYNFLISIGIEPKDINLFERDLISPGTEFMWNLEESILEFIKKKQKQDIYWQSLDIVFSGPNVEGEGEHKIISHIRQYQMSNNYISQTKFCIFSNDGDMILLSLLTHEPNIFILQEDNISSREDKVYELEFTKEHIFCTNNQVIFISVLREYLDLEFKNYFTQENEISIEYNINKIFDDLVLLCLLLGNDFIPGLMSLDRDGRIFEWLLIAYKDALPKCDDYLVKNTVINYNNLKEFFIEFSKFEKNILDMKNKELKLHYNILKKKKTFSAFKHYGDTMNEMIKEGEKNPNKIETLERALNTNQNFVKTLINSYEEENKGRLIEMDAPYEKLFFVEFMKEYNKGQDNIKNAKNMYYKKKLGKKNISEFFFSYLAGIQWIYYYYSNGISNYNWMYKYHYVPFISDLANYDISEDFNELINKKIIDFNSKPLTSYSLSCLSFNDKAFNELLPKQFSKVKKALNSFIRDINKTKIDLNGEIYIRNGYFLQPFLTQKQLNDLNKSINGIYNELSEENKKMNKPKKSIIFHKNDLLFENEDNEFIIDIINSLLIKFCSQNSSNEELRNNINYYLDNFTNEFLNDINNQYLPKIEENQKSTFLNKIKKVFEIFLNYKINIEDYDINISFNKSFLEKNYNKSFYTDITKFYDIFYPSINNLIYKYSEDSTIQELGKKYKFIKKTNFIKLNILSRYINITNNNNDNIVNFIKNILKEKIIIYGYPMKYIGLINCIYYKNKIYSLNDENIEIKDKVFPLINFHKKSALEYEDSKIIIEIKEKIKYTKDKINGNIKGIKLFNFEDKIIGLSEKYIPIELTSLNIQNEDENSELLNEINNIKFFYKNFCVENEETKDIKLNFMCPLIPSLIINTKTDEKFINIEKKIIEENKELQNKKLIFLCNANKIDNLKTVKENNLSEGNKILIMIGDSEKWEQDKQGQKEPEEDKE